MYNVFRTGTVPRLAVALLVAGVALAGCGSGGSSSTKADGSTPPSPSASAQVGESTTATVLVATEYEGAIADRATKKALGSGQNPYCERIPGARKVLHKGTEVTVEDSTSKVVGRGRLGGVPKWMTKQLPKDACAWSAKVKIEGDPAEHYRAVVDNQWVSKKLSFSNLSSKMLLVVVQ